MQRQPSRIQTKQSMPTNPIQPNQCIISNQTKIGYNTSKSKRIQSQQPSQQTRPTQIQYSTSTTVNPSNATKSRPSQPDRIQQHYNQANIFQQNPQPTPTKQSNPKESYRTLPKPIQSRAKQSNQTNTSPSHIIQPILSNRIRSQQSHTVVNAIKAHICK